MSDCLILLGKKAIYILPIAIILRHVFALTEVIFGRIIEVYALPERFGHLLVEPDILLARKLNGDNRILRFALKWKNTSSPALQKEWSMNFHRMPNCLLWCLYQYEITLGKRRFIFDFVKSIPDELGTLQIGNSVAFNKMIVSDYIQNIEKCNKKTVLLIVRDSNYDIAINSHTEGNHALYRDSNIENYRAGIEEFITQGYFVFKGGTHTSKLVNFENKKFLDLSSMTDNKSLDLLQFEVAKISGLVVSTDTGALHLGTLFRKPIYRLNFASFAMQNNYQLFRFFMFKDLYREGDNRKMSFEEMIKFGIMEFSHQNDLDKEGIRVIENNERAVLSFITEVIQDNNGSWVPNANSVRLSDHFKMLCNKYGYTIKKSPLFPNSWSNENIDFLL